MPRTAFRTMLNSLPFCWMCVLTLISTAGAQVDESDDLPAGLLGTYEAAGKTIERVDSGVSFTWRSSVPDCRLAAGPFKAAWSGLLLVQQPSRCRIHAYVEGKLHVELDGQRVLDAEASSPQWHSGPAFDPEPGLRSFAVSFEKIGESAEVHLFWSSDTFPLEPLPAHLLFRDGGRPDLAAIERGRQLVESRRCARCHQDDLIPRPAPAPDLSRSVSGLSHQTVQKQLTEGHGGVMPVFAFSPRESEAVAAFLVATGETTKLSAVPKRPRGRSDTSDRTAGQTLIHSLGCLACHQWGDLGNSGNFGGGNLQEVAGRRSAEWVFTWLSEPGRLNRDHRMPVFTLSREEKRLLAVTLGRQSDPEDDATVDSSLVATGRRLVTSARCTACHRISGLDSADVSSLKPLTGLSPDPRDGNSCLTAEPDAATGRPAYPRLDTDAVTAYLRSIAGSPSRASAFERGRELLTSLNCVACHPRESFQGLTATAGEVARSHSALQGQAPRLVPPSLTAVGDKLLDTALVKSIAGEQPRRMDWLHVRMPKFRHSDAEAAALTAYLIGHDRIPDGAPTWGQTAPADPPDDQTLLIGQELVGSKGWSCIACHQVGDYVPRKAIIGTRGSDLVGLGARMRYSYFLRWTRSPLRIVPGVEMPSYTRPVRHVLNEDVDRQLETLWQTLADPRFEPPTNPASVEQFIVVDSDDPARIIRDVFTNPEENGGGAIARAFAVGFGNGHSLLLDLDSLTLRRWTFGDFARQRTVGKSWYWDMAGSDVATGIGSTADSPGRSNYALVRSNVPDDQVLDAVRAPVSRNGTNGRLVAYSPDGDGVRLKYVLNFELDGELKEVPVTETLSPTTSPGSGRTGWTRDVAVESVPDGYDLVLQTHLSRTVIGKPVALKASGPRVRFLKSADSQPDHASTLTLHLRLSANAGQAGTRIQYLSHLKRLPLSVTLKEAAAAARTEVRAAPGFDGVQLPLPARIMPTALSFLESGQLVFTSLQGHVYAASDSSGDGVEDTLTLIEDGLASPYGVIQDGESLIVAHKPELLRLQDTDGDGRADLRTVFSTGWGYNDNYHDWTCGIVRDDAGNLYVGLGSDYAQRTRPRDQARWRGKVLRIDAGGSPTPFSHGFRYPTGLAIDSQGRLFATDNQGVQNTFNEINHLRPDTHYGVPKRYEEDLKVDAQPPAIQVPHPWTRSINGIAILPDDFPIREFAGHGIGAEYNGKLLIRFTYHEVDGQLQGAAYFLTRPDFDDTNGGFLGPISVAVSPRGEIYVGSIHDSGWLGGLNTGSIVRLTPNGRLPAGIREIQATRDGFEISFTRAVDASSATRPDSYSISGYTRVWQGSYATPDSGRYQPTIESVTLSDDRLRARLRVSPLKVGFVYEINCRLIVAGQSLWPETGHYTMHRIPGQVSGKQGQ